MQTHEIFRYTDFALAGKKGEQRTALPLSTRTSCQTSRTD
jgi:hypothetical protein